LEKNRIKFTVAENNDKKRNKQRWVGQEKNSKIVIKSCHLILHYYREFLQTAHKRLTCASPFILIVNVFIVIFFCYLGDFIIEWRRLSILILIYIKLLNSMDTQKHWNREKLDQLKKLFNNYNLNKKVVLIILI